MLGGILGGLFVCVAGLGIFIYVLTSRKRDPGPAQAVSGAGDTEMPVVALPVTGGLNADQLAKQQASPAVAGTASPQQAPKHSIAI